MSQYGQGYLNTGNMNSQDPKFSQWEDFVRQLQFSQLDNVTNFKSPLYQQFYDTQRKQTPGMGMNTLLGMSMAGGTGYAGGQGIAAQKAMQFDRQRNDSINNGLGNFIGQQQGQVQGLLGQIGGSFAATADRKLAQEQADAASSPWGAIGSAVGGIGGFLLGGPAGGMLGASLLGGATSGGGVGGYNSKPRQGGNSGNGGWY